MDLEPRLHNLENSQEWHALAEGLEQGIANISENSLKAEYHLRLGRLQRDRFLQGVKALKHFQDAFKLDPQRIEALVEAREVYWELGKLNMVQKLLELQLKNTPEPEAGAALCVLLGDVLSDQGEYERATEAYAKAIQLGGDAESSPNSARQGLEDVQVSPDGWQEHISGLLRAAHEVSAGPEKAASFLRAARVAGRFAPDEVPAILGQAYQADPGGTVAGALFEGLLVAREQVSAIADAQQQILGSALDDAAKGRVAYRFGVRWATRHQNLDLAKKLFEEALRLSPGQSEAFSCLREIYGAEENWAKAIEVATALAERTSGADQAAALAAAGTMAWRGQGDLIRARGYFEQLAAVAPAHPALAPFEAQIGERLGPAGSADPGAADSGAPDELVVVEDEAPEAVEAEASADEASAEEVIVADEASDVEISAVEEAAPAPADEGRIAELREALVKQEEAKRYHEYVKTLVELADEVTDPAEKVELYGKAAELYVNKFVNQAEAVKAYEKVLEVDPYHPEAAEYLRGMYEKRRDWEKLISLQRSQAELLTDSASRVQAFKELAALATERVKKPDVCIELWSVVLDNDPDDLEALGALSQLHERARDYERLAGVLEQLAARTYDTKEKIEILTKLGQVAGDRLKDDARAVEAYRELLVLQPDDRRAQEQLKKRYVSLGMWDDLEVFYHESGKWDEFIRVLESNEAKASSPEESIRMLLKIAELWMTQKGKPDRAARAYEKILSLDATNLEAAERVIPIYSSTNNAKGLCHAIEVKLGHVEDPAERLDLLRQVAGLYESRINDKAKAFERFLEAFELEPGDEQCQADVERAAAATAGWPALVASYRQAIERLASDGDAVGAINLRLRLGRVLVEEVGQVDEALSEYRAVYELEPDNALALAALEGLYAQTERWADLLEVYSKRRELAVEPEERKAILFSIARLHEERLNALEDAIQTYRAVLEDDPVDAGALAALDRLYRQLEQWEPYAEVLTRRIELDVEEAELIDFKYRLADTQLTHLSEPGLALENYREILFLNQDHEGARGALEGLLEHSTAESSPELRGEAASILEAIYEVRGDWQKLIQVLEILVLAAPDAERQVELLRRIAVTSATQLGDVERAFDAQARAVKTDPAHGDARLEFEGLAQQSNAWVALLGVYSEVAQNLQDPELARSYWLRIAAIEEQLGRVEEAAKAYAQVLNLDPADGEALEALDALYRNHEQWGELIGVFRRRIELSDDAASSEELYAQMAEVYEVRLGQPEEAIGAYREVLGLDPTSQRALRALDGLFTRQERWQELAENLEVQLSLADSEEVQLALMLRLSALREQQMQQVDGAIEGYREVLDRDATNVNALAALERLGASPEHELVIAEILEPLYRQQGDYQKLIGVHEVQVRRADDANRQVELLHQIAELYEDAGGDPNRAFDTLARALTVDPAHDFTQEGLDRLARTTGRFTDLARVFEELAAQQEEPELASQLYTFAARVFVNDVGDVDRAIELFRRVLTIDPTNLGAAEALESLFQSTERYGDMSIILQRKAEILEDVEAQKAALYQAATLEEEVLERKESAIGVYQKILEIDPEDVRSVDSLIHLFLGLSRWEELLGVYSKKADLVFDTEERKLIYYQVGAVYERELGDVPRSIDTYQRVLELDPDDLTALGRLDVLYQSTQNWPELLSVLTHQSELTADPAEAISYQYRIAELYERHLDDVVRAVELYSEILNVQPDHEPTLAALEGIKSGSREPLAAAAVLEPVYDAMGEWARLISVLEVQARFAEDPFGRVDLLHRIARLYEENLAQHGEAFDTYARAVAADNQNEESLGSLERLAMTLERWPSVARLYDEQLTQLDNEPDRFVELALRVAQVYEVQLEQVDSAIARYRQVLEVEPENQSAVRSLDRLFSQTERWGELAEVLRREAEIGQTPDEILEFKYRLGQVYQLRLSDLDQAIEAYREVLSAAPEHAETLEALEALFAANIKQVEIADILEPLYQSTGEWEKLIQVHEAQLQSTQDPEERLAMYYRIAEDAEERLMDPYQAFAVYARAIKEQPLDERTSDEIERLAAMIDGGWEQLANGYADVLGMEGLRVEVQAAIGKRLARVFEEELADVAKAEETYRYVLTVAPGDQESLANLDRIYSSLEQYAELAGVLEQRALGAEPHEQAELYTRLGQVYEESLGQIPDAIRAYRRIFDELEPTNEEAIEALGRIYEQTEDWEALNVVYQRELENAAGDVAEAEIRAKMAHLAAGRLGRLDEAVEGWKRVLDLRGEDPEALAALAGLYQHRQQWAELTDVLERQFDIADDDEERVNVLSARARLFIEQLGRDDEALETWQRVLDIDYANLAALRAVAQIWRTREDAQELVSALHAIVDRAAALLDPAELTEVYRELGQTYGQKLEQPYDAADAWRQLLEVDPGDFEAMAELERIYRLDEKWVEVIEVKSQRAEALGDPAEQIRELLEVTEIWKREVNDYDQATTAFERVLTIDPAHTGAFEALERLHTAAGRWEPLVELYLNRLETREEVAERGELLRRIAKVFEVQLSDNNQAFDALVNAFSEDYGDEETGRYLERMAQQTGRWGELINTANAWLQETEDPTQKIQLCLRLGKWYGEDLGHPEYAQPYYAQIVQLDPNNVQVLRQMANIHRIGGHWQKMGEVLTRALDVAVANDDRKAIRCDLGELLERHMNEVDKGIAEYKRALEVDPHYMPALEALERIYDNRGNHQELVEILGRKVAGLTDPEDVAQHKLRMGGLYETALGDFDRAGKTYREVLELDGSSIFALRGLERIYDALQNWVELVEVFERQLDVVETERERVEVLLKLALIQEEQFLKPDLAAQRLEQALEIDPGDARAYIALTRCYRRLKQWLDLINTYERHISEAASHDDKVILYGHIAQVFADEVGDVDRAIDAYQNIVDLDETNIPALEALSRLYEKQEDPGRAIEAMTRVADLTTDGTQRVEMYYRIGTALESKLGDRLQAQERFEMALDLNPAHLPSLSALRTIAVDEADWDRAARYLDQEQLNTELPRQRAKLLVELGRLRDEMLGEHEAAVEAYELAMQCDEDCEEAALPLVEEYMQTGRYPEAEPLAELLVRKGRNRERSEQHMQQKLLGKVLAALGKDEKALKAYQAAHQLDLTDQETIRGIADVSFRLADWPSALTNYQKVLTSLGEEETDERTDVYYRLGCIKREQQQAKQAINNFEKALALNPEHRPTLEALVDVYQTAGDYKQVAAYKRQILDGVFDGNERYDILNEIADLWAEKENNPAKAIEALEEALDLKPQEPSLLHKILELYQKAEDWQKMVDTLQAIADISDSPQIKARCFNTMAQLYRDKLEDPDRAIELFNDALDVTPDFLQAFERINKILTRDRNWPQLERQYRKMVHRIRGKGNTDLEHTLWHQLGLIFRDRLGQTDDAIVAFKNAVEVKPSSLEDHQILSELYEGAERFDEAIAEQRQILALNPQSIKPFRGLYRLYLHKRSYDEAWPLAAAMSFLGRADAEESRFYTDYRLDGMLQVKGRLSSEHWARLLFHANLNLHVTKIFEMIVPAALKAKVEQLSRQPSLVDPRFKQDPQSSTVTFAKTFGWAAQVLGLPTPELYVRSDLNDAVRAVPYLPPVSVAGKAVLSGFQPEELTFICGKHLASYRPELYMRNLFPTQDELKIMLFSALAMVDPNTPVPPEFTNQIRMTVPALAKHIQPIEAERLKAAVKPFLAEKTAANIKSWAQAAELTQLRAGLLVCGDLTIARKIIALEPVLPGDLTVEEKLQELLLFSVSEQYAQLRAALGITIGA
ncbi:MAG: tetratricopeptide repeat protein [Polyangiaceae bacterium]|nr:tetratricopeptide repeat protein [Polyangiaceae bacterium]MCW5791757.1 tetratricopeptide repeat protein [Polyangiaceae bacterium]